ncbi:ferric transport system permease protein FbpB [Thermoclostridium stercorarium subsp. stercorarium DSM 8532]|jgi:iron(III) transport system permease protein|uniref:Ferric transport system permease protein FbpB n=2 Tax=Thermoclostridium stercorarium TaxID=1510 RepID=L7VVY5_THES1|nr:iron ABC transporter permease [Thermoclostridium stercorarium]AGC69693.1 ferric transport system permease protein FbpB [Thermoclostridium stercorarium subsp. stercorarium DSM 8532]AGI40645.1 ABC transporter permease subunit [Thermoclostridium stercorarium subsp. stercorarium DSM 8532]ANX02536.1 iron ABC transporter permease [Thermoclostridium stercorarium subsp. leptospartum DSM 9219]UZQ85629.1 iron ABC transporter permease [Thermoclostridium stercorarium]
MFKKTGREFLKGYRIDFWSFVTMVSLIYFAMFLIYPVGRLVFNAFQTKDAVGVFSFDNFIKFFSKPYYRNSVWNSVKVTFCATFLTVVIGVTLAYITTNFKIKGIKAVNILIIISMFSPPFIGAYSWILLLGRAGVITKFLKNNFGIDLPTIYGFNGILLVFTLKLFPYIYMYTKGALKKVDKALIEAAESLGDHGLKKVIKVSLPLVTPTILAGSAIVFLRAFADYGTPRLIGEGYTVMPVLIYNEWLSETGSNAYFASAIAFIMILVAIVVYMLQMYFSRKNYNMSMLNPPVPKPIKGAGAVFAHLFVYLVTLLATLPTAYITFISFKNFKSSSIMVEGFSLTNYVLAWNKAKGAILNTFKFGIISIIIIVLLGTMFAYVTVRRRNIFSRFLDACVQLPYVIPGTIYGLMLLISYNSGFLALSGGAILIITAYVIRRMPYTVRSSAAILRQINQNIEEASLSLGYSPVATFFKVTMPAMIPGVVSGAILSWITLIQELSATLMLYTSKTSTMATAIFQEVNRSAYGTAAALSTILTFTMVASLLLFFRITGNADVDM